MTAPEPSPQGRITAVCVVFGLMPSPKAVGKTGLDKRPVPGPVYVDTLGLQGDQICDLVHHGGEEQAVYAYAAEDAQWWSEQLGRPIPPGWFGENLHTTGIDVTNAVIGERWRVGEALLEVTTPRLPCVTFAERMGIPGWVKSFVESGRSGAYLAVREPGHIREGDPVTVVHRPAHGVRIVESGLRPDRAALKRLLAADGKDGLQLYPRMRERCETVTANPLRRLVAAMKPYGGDAGQ